MFKAILTILIWIMIVGNASAIQDPFLVYGYVKYDNGSMVDGATVNISVPDQALAETTNSMGKYTGVLDMYQDGDEIIVTTVKGLYTGSAADILDKSSGGLIKNITITVNELNHAPVLASIGVKSTNEGSTLEFTIFATDLDSDPLTYSATDLPIGATFNYSTHTFSWTPGENQSGSYQVHFEVTDGSLSDAEDVTITITENPTTPTLVSITPSSLQLTPGTQFTLTIPITPATPITGAQFTFLFNRSLATITNVTEGNLLNQDGASTIFNSGTINNAAGTVTNVYSSIISSTSVSSQGSMATINMTAGSTTGYLDLNLTNVMISDANSCAAPYSLTNATVLIDTPPKLGSIGAKSVDEENELVFTISASDVDGNSLTYSATSLPGGASFNTASGAFSWTPVDDQAGTYVVTFEVTDGYLSDSEAVTITVNESNHAPVMDSIGAKSVDEENELVFTISASDVDGNSLTYSATSLPGGANFDTGSRAFSWTPVDGLAGTYVVTFEVTDGDLSDSETVTIIVNEVNHAPVLVSIGARYVDEENTLAFTLSASDEDGNSLTYSATNLPDGASFNTASGAFSWMSMDGQAGNHVVTFEVTDGDLSDSEAVTITVNEINHAPVITAFEPADGSVFNEVDVINIGVNATDVDGHALIYSIKIDGVTHSTGSSYAWETDYSSAGTHTIDVTVSDGTDQATGQHIITVNNVHPRWDVNEDNSVNILDITIVCQKYGTTVEAPYPRWDVNQDGVVNIQDIAVVGYYFGETVVS